MKKHRFHPLLATLLLVLAPIASAQEAEVPPPQILFENVRVFDGTSDELTKPTSVLVENNLIKAIGSGAGAEQMSEALKRSKKLIEGDTTVQGK